MTAKTTKNYCYLACYDLRGADQQNYAKVTNILRRNGFKKLQYSVRYKQSTVPLTPAEISSLRSKFNPYLKDSDSSLYIWQAYCNVLIKIPIPKKAVRPNVKS